MGATAKRSFDLSAEQAAFIDRKVASGEFSSANALIEEGIRTLQEREAFDDELPEMDEATLERLIRDEVMPVYEQLMADPSSAIPAEEVFDRLRKRHEERMAQNPK
jgi:putative addiction module CopG family antidote